MKKTLLLSAAVAALVFASVAGANNGNGNANKSPNGARTGHFTRTYVNGIGGTFTCNGERIAKAGAFTKDEEECTISDASTFLPQGKTVATPTFLLFGINWFWQSDFDGTIAKTVTYVVSGARPDGSAHVKLIANY